jgi:pimeloyl-ACP methyl ester carboxylesterase
MHEDPEFRWLERGTGEPVVLLHGLMGQMHHWDVVLDAVGAGYRLIAPTLPVFHPELRETSVGALGRYVLRFLDALDIPRAVLGGNSLGGRWSTASVCRGWCSPDRPGSSSGASRAGSRIVRTARGCGARWRRCFSTPRW